MHNEEVKKGSEDLFGFSQAVKNQEKVLKGQEDEEDEEVCDIEEYTPSMNKQNKIKQETKSKVCPSLVEEKVMFRKTINDVLTNEKLLVNKNN